ncbi:MAG: type II secretion system protein GspF, partial [bacterium]|nr:type II secretion system protein GspF [bacterium]
MPLFRYKAVAADGRVVEGRHEAPDDRHVVARLRHDGQVPLEIKPAAPGHWSKRRVDHLFARDRLSGRRLARMCVDLATLLRAGVAVDRAIDIQRESSDDTRVRAVLDRVYEGVRRGLALSDAMEALQDTFPL